MKFIYVALKFSRMICLKNGCTWPKLSVYRGTEKNNKTLRSKISFGMVWQPNKE